MPPQPGKKKNVIYSRQNLRQYDSCVDQEWGKQIV